MNRLIEIYGIDGQQKLNETSLPLIIGADEQAHIRLPGDGGAAAFVGESRNHLFLQPAQESSFQPLSHNNEPLRNSVWLKSGDTTRIGDFLVRWQLASQRVEILVSRYAEGGLTPPSAPPDKVKPDKQEAAEDSLHPVLEPPRRTGSRFRYLVLALFLILLGGAAFVLLAKPVTINIVPVPDSLTVSGFPPVVSIGDSYLGFPGHYLLRAEKAGFRPLEERVEISRIGSSYNFSFQKLPGYLEVTSQPPGATLSVDGVPEGKTPLSDVELPLGRRSLRFELQRYQSVEQQLLVKGAGERQSLQVELLPDWASVVVRSEPAGASLSVDGEDQGLTPLTLELLAGERQLTFRKDKFSPLTLTLQVVAGQEMTPAQVLLSPAPASLTISSQPTGATVTVDGDFKGQTPLTLSLKTEVEHEIGVTASGYRPQNRKLKLVADAKRKIAFRLEPEYGVVFIAATPPDATLYIDGKKQPAGSGRVRLPSRVHSFELRANGYQSVTRTVTPQSGYSQRLEIELPPKQEALKAAASFAAPPANTQTAVGQQLVLIKPTAFLMGASRREAGRRANEVEQQVVLQRSFYLSAREVTNSEFRQFQPQHSSGTAGNKSLDIDSHPVVNVSWEDAVRFLNWLSNKDGLPAYYQEQNGKLVVTDSRGIGYRLPTEAEWAFSARMAGRKERARYPWPGNYPPQGKVGNFADEAARDLLPMVIDNYNDGFSATAPVGSFPANPAGIYDLGGNVAEWCHDYYSPSRSSTKGSQIDPLGAATGTHHLVRGASWRDASITELRFSYRRYSKVPASDIGFRVARYAR